MNWNVFCVISHQSFINHCFFIKMCYTRFLIFVEIVFYNDRTLTSFCFESYQISNVTLNLNFANVLHQTNWFMKEPLLRALRRFANATTILDKLITSTSTTTAFVAWQTTTFFSNETSFVSRFPQLLEVITIVLTFFNNIFQEHDINWFNDLVDFWTWS